MKKELWFYRFLRWVGLTKAYEIDKKEMCEKAKSVCSENCERCVWHQQYCGDYNQNRKV